MADGDPHPRPDAALHHLAFLADVGLDGIVWEADASGVAYTFVSAELENLLGYAPEKWLEDPRFWESILHPDDRDAVLACRKRAALEAVRQRIDYRIRSIDGRLVWFRDHIRPVTDGAGRAVQLQGLMLDITDRKRAERRQEAQHAVVRVLAEATSTAEAAGRILAAVCQSLEWDVGLLWTVDEHIRRLRCVEVWTAPGVQTARFEQLSRSMLFEPGVGLPGRVWASRAPAWITNVVVDPNFPRAPIALEEGLHGAFAFPIRNGTGFVGVIEFFSREVREPDADLLQMMSTVGTQIGQFVTRKRLEEDSNFRKLLLEAQMDATVDGIFVLAPDRSVLYYNRRLLELWGVEDEEASDRDRFVKRQLELVADPERFTKVIEESSSRPLLSHRDELVLRDGRALDRYSAPLLGADGMYYGRIVFFREITEQKRAEQILRESKERNEFLAEGSALLSTSLDVPTTLRSFARLLVPRIGDWCGIDLLNEEGDLERMAWSHHDTEKEALVGRLVELYPPEADATTGSPNVVRTGKPELYERITEEMVAASARDERHLGLLRSLELRSAMVVPLIARGRTLGALTLVSSSRTYGGQDLAFAEEIAARAAIAVDNARLYSERSHVARVLQQSLLPPVLPAVPGASLAARYMPAGHGNEVGGDFYDVFATGRDDWAVVVGDVCGKGSEAAAVTALARYTIRAAAMQAKKPTRVLTTLNEAMLRQRSDRRFCTVVYARLRRVEGGIRTTVACGGHPQPIVVHADGKVETAGVPGTLLGFFPDPDLTDYTVHLGPRDTLILYTDGVTEGRNEHDVFGEARLRELLAGCGGMDATAIARRIENAVLGFQLGVPRDDLAILAVQAT